ncbi:hypothetical protein CXG81DRAFT_23137 [Caulochytrium protostelioides]|uniref:Uncharacterized protein n=1 Tax=Caulochytrium protostelioides TaxID=1555241 RepID=A0A4P9XF47_9FUNG|nr:hypothetical protein CXG81DRAFT_23137 [Caulochytrium protostelioides]|eukprot:RKP04184.1 hypothetical protein CXG81DRAFT_23137 [Caulochytrium protostelioides]
MTVLWSAAARVAPDDDGSASASDSDSARRAAPAAAPWPGLVRTAAADLADAGAAVALPHAGSGPAPPSPPPPPPPPPAASLSERDLLRVLHRFIAHNGAALLDAPLPLPTAADLPDGQEAALPLPVQLAGAGAGDTDAGRRRMGGSALQGFRDHIGDQPGVSRTGAVAWDAFHLYRLLQRQHAHAVALTSAASHPALHGGFSWEAEVETGKGPTDVAPVSASSASPATATTRWSMPFGGWFGGGPSRQRENDDADAGDIAHGSSVPGISALGLFHALGHRRRRAHRHPRRGDRGNGNGHGSDEPDDDEEEDDAERARALDDAQCASILEFLQRLPALKLSPASPDRRLRGGAPHDAAWRFDFAPWRPPSAPPLRCLEVYGIPTTRIAHWDRIALHLEALVLSEGALPSSDAFRDLLNPAAPAAGRDAGRDAAPSYTRPAAAAAAAAIPDSESLAASSPPAPAAALASPMLFMNLVVLDLSRNGLTELPAACMALVPRCIYLNLSFNPFDAVPPSLALLAQLTVLDAEGCRIVGLTGAEDALRGVTHLNLAGNALESVAGAESLVALAQLDVRHNRIADVYDLARLGPLPDLREVRVEGNPLTQRSPTYRATLLTYFRDRAESVLLDGRRPTPRETQAIRTMLVSRPRHGHLVAAAAARNPSPTPPHPVRALSRSGPSGRSVHSGRSERSEPSERSRHSSRSHGHRRRRHHAADADAAEVVDADAVDATDSAQGDPDPVDGEHDRRQRRHRRHRRRHGDPADAPSVTSSKGTTEESTSTATAATASTATTATTSAHQHRQHRHPHRHHHHHHHHPRSAADGTSSTSSTPAADPLAAPPSGPSLFALEARLAHQHFAARRETSPPAASRRRALPPSAAISATTAAAAAAPALAGRPRLSAGTAAAPFYLATTHRAARLGRIHVSASPAAAVGAVFPAEGAAAAVVPAAAPGTAPAPSATRRSVVHGIPLNRPVSMSSTYSRAYVSSRTLSVSAAHRSPGFVPLTSPAGRPRGATVSVASRASALVPSQWFRSLPSLLRAASSSASLSATVDDDRSPDGDDDGDDDDARHMTTTALCAALFRSMSNALRLWIGLHVLPRAGAAALVAWSAQCCVAQLPLFVPETIDAAVATVSATAPMAAPTPCFLLTATTGLYLFTANPDADRDAVAAAAAALAAAAPGGDEDPAAGRDDRWLTYGFVDPGAFLQLVRHIPPAALVRIDRDATIGAVTLRYDPAVRPDGLDSGGAGDQHAAAAAEAKDGGAALIARLASLVLLMPTRDALNALVRALQTALPCSGGPGPRDADVDVSAWSRRQLAADLRADTAPARLSTLVVHDPPMARGGGDGVGDGGGDGGGDAASLVLVRPRPAGPDAPPPAALSSARGRGGGAKAIARRWTAWMGASPPDASAAPPAAAFPPRVRKIALPLPPPPPPPSVGDPQHPDALRVVCAAAFIEAAAAAAVDREPPLAVWPGTLVVTPEAIELVTLRHDVFPPVVMDAAGAPAGPPAAVRGYTPPWRGRLADRVAYTQRRAAAPLARLHAVARARASRYDAALRPPQDREAAAAVAAATNGAGAPCTASETAAGRWLERGGCGPLMRASGAAQQPHGWHWWLRFWFTIDGASSDGASADGVPSDGVPSPRVMYAWDVVTVDYASAEAVIAAIQAATPAGHVRFLLDHDD